MLDDAAFGAASEVEAKFTSHSDPAAQWTAAMKGPAFFAYANNYLIDADNAVIVDVEATRAIRQTEIGADTHDDLSGQASGSVSTRRSSSLIRPTARPTCSVGSWGTRVSCRHIPLFDRSMRNDGTFANTDFVFDQEANEHTCPGGKRLKKYWRLMFKPRSGIGEDGFIRYYARKSDCAVCPLKAKCTPNQPARKIASRIHEGTRDLAREIADDRCVRREQCQAKEDRDDLRSPQTHP